MERKNKKFNLDTIKFVEEENKKNLVSKYLKYLGLKNFNLCSMETIKAQIKSIIEDNDNNNCSYFRDSGFCINDKGEKSKIMSLFYIIDKKINSIDFCFIKQVEGEYINKIEIYKNLINNKYYIFRSAQIVETQHYKNEYLYNSFMEFLKHIILYFLLKYHYPDTKYKIIPEIYHFGKYRNPTTKQITFITVMELGNITFGDYFEHNSTNYIEIKKKLFTIFRSLELLNDLGLNFKHGDMKFNNIIMTETNKPLLIDFDKATFIFDDLFFDDHNQTSEFYEYKKNEGLCFGYLNVTHDMMQLLSSFELLKTRDTSGNIVSFFDMEIFNFDNNYVLSNKNMKKIGIYNYTNYYNSGDLNQGISLVKLQKKYKDIRFTIRSVEFAKILEIDDFEDNKIFDKYIKKYLKYKIKYIKLKNSNQ
jgi:thiamine kinase-like enzyme